MTPLPEAEFPEDPLEPRASAERIVDVGSQRLSLEELGPALCSALERRERGGGVAQSELDQRERRHRVRIAPPRQLPRDVLRGLSATAQSIRVAEQSLRMRQSFAQAQRGLELRDCVGIPLA